ncbi:MAG: hypothetical protein K1X64_02290 [Myxococcaceae bacterium]|nr:hypothetical protein [Myxococcaceae bacterium]
MGPLGGVVLLLTAAHVRIAGSNGPIHVWWPEREAAPTQTVAYVHGYFDDVDEAWAAHGLASQFERSGVNAVFILPEAPTGPNKPVNYPHVERLLDEVDHGLGWKVPRKELLALGHSGGYRTLKAWTRSTLLRRVVLLDAFYGEAATWAKWLDGDARHRLLIVAAITRRRSEPWAVKRGAVSLTLASLAEGGWPEKNIVHLLVNAGHMEVITDGEVIPLVVRSGLRQH